MLPCSKFGKLAVSLGILRRLVSVEMTGHYLHRSHCLSPGGVRFCHPRKEDRMSDLEGSTSLKTSNEV